MKSPPFDYFCPKSLAEAVDLLVAHDNAKVLAGGQSLMSMLNLRYLFPDVLVDINRIPGLDEISIKDDVMRIGAMTRQHTIERNADVARVAPIFPLALVLVGHRQTRNRGTIGGSLCHLDPAAELATLALLYDVVVEVAGRDGSRRKLPIGEFIAGFMMPNIEQHEIVSAVELPLWRKGHGYGFHEFARRHGDFAVASAACLIDRDAKGTVTRAAIAIGGVGSVPQRLASAEMALVGGAGDAASVQAALECCDELDAVGDFHGGPQYRQSVARSMLKKSLGDALSRASEVI